MSILDNYKYIVSQISVDSKATELLVVTKGRLSSELEPLLDYGHRSFGESKLQEAREKWQPLRSTLDNLKLHFIGRLQRNKLKGILQLFDVIETLDRDYIAKEIATYVADYALDNKEFLIQVNIGDEPLKGGVKLSVVGEFIEYCMHDLGLNIKGLMCLPPKDKVPDEYFNIMRDKARSYNFPVLSMGMSSDYIAAIKCGSTRVRIGRKIFADQ